MKNNKKNKYNPRQYWKKKIGFDSKEELLIYQYLCGNIRKKDAKRLDESKKFQEYKTWRQHVEEILKKCDTDELEEFFRFAKSNARVCDNDMGMHVYLALPLAVSMTGAIMLRLFELILSVNTQIHQYTGLKAAALFILLLMMSFASILIMARLLLFFWRKYINSRSEKGFWADYLEIIEAKCTTHYLL